MLKRQRAHSKETTTTTNQMFAKTKEKILLIPKLMTSWWLNKWRSTVNNTTKNSEAKQPKSEAGSRRHTNTLQENLVEALIISSSYWSY